MSRQGDLVLTLRRIHREFLKLGIDPNSRIVEITPEGGVKVTPCDSTLSASAAHRDPAEGRLDAVEQKIKAKAIPRDAAPRA